MPTYLEFEVSLVGIKPRIWRRFLLLRDATFADLHLAIQHSLGWYNRHLWEFREKGRRGEAIATAAGVSGNIGYEAPPATRVRLSRYFDAPQPGRSCLYQYDFGDSWDHVVKVRKVVELPGKFHRRLLGGARACPPEDCGGVWGYEECMEVATAPDPAAVDADRAEWLGDWDPEAFDLDATKARFDR